VSYEADESSRTERAARETEHMDLVARIVIEDQETVSLAHIVDESMPEHATAKLVEFTRTDALIVVDNLWNAFGIDPADARSCQHYVGRDIGKQLVPSAIETKN